MAENEYLSRDEAVALLLRSVKEWNAYREANPDYRPSLLAANFNGVDLSGADLSGADLRGIDLNGADLSGADLSDADLGTDISEAFIRGDSRYRVNLSKDTTTVNSLPHEADLIKDYLIEAYQRGTNLSGANLHEADLRLANLRGVNLCEVCFREADLRGTHLSRVDLREADLSRADLGGANFHEADLNGADLSGAEIDNTFFTNVDLSSTLNLEEVVHRGPSSISIDTLFKSHFNIPDIFLEGAGVPRKLIEYLPSFKALPIEYYSCFISYSSKDEAFAKRLYEGLKSKGIRVWYAPEEMKGGRFLHDQIDQAIRLHDKLLLVLSDDSMNSTWVNTEIYKARKKEKQSGKKVLFPISIVPHEKIQDWECFDADTGMDMARDIRRFYIPDFTRWKDHDSFQAEFEKLVRDLQASEEEK